MIIPLEAAQVHRTIYRRGICKTLPPNVLPLLSAACHNSEHGECTGYARPKVLGYSKIKCPCPCHEASLFTVRVEVSA